MELKLKPAQNEEITILDDDGNVVICILLTSTGYTNIDIHRPDAKARAFRLGEDGYITANGRVPVELPEFNGFVSIDFGELV